MKVELLQRLLEIYVFRTGPSDLCDTEDNDISFDDTGTAMWSPDDVIWTEDGKTVIAVRRMRIIDSVYMKAAEDWLKGFAKFAGVGVSGLTTMVTRDNGADYDIEIRAVLDSPAFSRINEMEAAK